MHLHGGASLERRFRSAHSALDSMADRWNQQADVGLQQRPFITISRPVGIDAEPLTHALATELGGNWSAWDHELIEKVAADHSISQQFIERIENERHNWIEEAFASISPRYGSSYPDEAKVYKRIVATVAALAESGHTIIVGKACRCITAKLPGGRHIRLVAPKADRVANVARELNLSPDAAEARLTEMDEARMAFYHRYWPRFLLGPESFALTINVSDVTLDQAVRCIAALVREAPVAAMV